MDDENSLAGRVRKAREARGLTQDQLAKLIGVNSMTVSRIERSETIDPPASTVIGLARELGVHERYLMTGSIEAGPSDIPDPPHWAEFRMRYQHLAAFDEETLRAVKQFAARYTKVRSWVDIERIAEIVRAGGGPSVAFAKAVARVEEEEDLDALPDPPAIDPYAQRDAAPDPYEGGLQPRKKKR